MRELTPEKIQDLETRLSFQEDMLTALNKRVAEQDEEIARLQYQLKHMNQKFNDSMTDSSSDQPEDQRPPHY